MLAGRMIAELPDCSAAGGDDLAGVRRWLEAVSAAPSKTVRARRLAWCFVVCQRAADNGVDVSRALAVSDPCEMDRRRLVVAVREG